MRDPQATDEHAREQRREVEGSSEAEPVDQHSEERLAQGRGESGDHGNGAHLGKGEPELVHRDGIQGREEPRVDVAEEMGGRNEQKDRGEGNDRLRGVFQEA